MIKIISTLSMLAAFMLAQGLSHKTVSKYEIKNGKKVYYPVKNKAATRVIQNQIVQSDIKIPVVKGFYVEYKR